MKRANGASAKSSPRFRVEVASKYGQDDPHGAALIAQLPSIGLMADIDVRVSSLYEVAGNITKNQAQQLSRELLADPVTQEFRLGDTTPSQAFLVGPHWRVEVWLKPTVTDPVGESVREAARDLGLPKPNSVRTGKAYRIIGKQVSRAQVDKILNRLLANPVIHSVDVVSI